MILEPLNVPSRSREKLTGRDFKMKQVYEVVDDIPPSVPTRAGYIPSCMRRRVYVTPGESGQVRRSPRAERKRASETDLC